MVTPGTDRLTVDPPIPLMVRPKATMKMAMRRICIPPNA
jgi:hypothetical protein